MDVNGVASPSEENKRDMLGQAEMGEVEARRRDDQISLGSCVHLWCLRSVRCRGRSQTAACF
jgi:hypothetical protein